MSTGTLRVRQLRELLVLIDEFDAGWEVFVSRGALNSEGRKVCVRIGTLAGHLFPGTPYKVKWVLGDASDAHVRSALDTIRNKAITELEHLGAR
ncbi:hypothetical protein B9Q08_00825 [Candidatus Marsarchaeota G2 archaeon ECH_B_SAG-M15]|uniref:Uncharacterized protein n=1 Tax=Candidatus Marsarchaeota G2 archaeon ECH_B_SAG-M15 TaxID=1978162 RepID=A0A2R6B2D7_9ARCH|nr:MAG: hypothetical protein B9Q08_00825 [Candidatus Marsarchaeota G2 archaeon ECH_B_SAG-M15]